MRAAAFFMGVLLWFFLILLVTLRLCKKILFSLEIKCRVFLYLISQLSRPLPYRPCPTGEGLWLPLVAEEVVAGLMKARRWWPA